RCTIGARFSMPFLMSSLLGPSATADWPALPPVLGSLQPTSGNSSASVNALRNHTPAVMARYLRRGESRSTRPVFLQGVSLLRSGELRRPHFHDATVHHQHHPARFRHAALVAEDGERHPRPRPAGRVDVDVPQEHVTPLADRVEHYAGLRV